MFASSLLTVVAILVLDVASANVPQVKIGNTIVNGATGPFNVDFFGGFPFAKPPVGNLRFSPPVSVTTLSGATFDASAYGPPCLQLPIQPGMSEDCLTVNVFRPNGVSADAKLPVMVWVYGGGFINGMASLYNATLLVAQSVARGTPMVYVNLNYRLGPLGFPTGSEALAKGLTNVGLKDQLAALQWVQANIASFGGDKTKVTLFGESAGAISISHLFLNSNLERLIRAAIFESGSPSTSPMFTAASGTPLWQVFANAVPACAGRASGNTIDCLRTANSSEILSAALVADQASFQEFAFVPVIDGERGVIPASPAILISEGKFSKIPFISGTNLDEGTVFTPKSINSTADLISFLEKILTSLGSNNNTISSTIRDVIVRTTLVLYPDNPSAGSPFGTGNNTFGLSPEWKRGSAIIGDSSFQGPRRQWINAAASRGVKTFGYLFTDPSANTGTNGVSHGTEVPYVYGATILTGTPTAATLSGQIIDYWISFATSLNPNDGKGSQRINWPQYTSTSRTLVQLNGQNLTTIPDTYRQEQIDFINANPVAFRHRKRFL